MASTTEETYAKTPQNSVNRYHTRATYSKPAIHALINETLMLNVCFNAPLEADFDPSQIPAPSTFPMIGFVGHYPGQYDESLNYDPRRSKAHLRATVHGPHIPGAFDDDGDNDALANPATTTTTNGDADGIVDGHIYLHTHAQSRLAELCKPTPQHPDGYPLTVSATRVDGLVLALTPFNHSYNYASAVAYCKGVSLPTFLPNPSSPADEPPSKHGSPNPEALWAQATLTNKVTPQRWQHSRTPPDRAELTTTVIIKCAVESAVGKSREGPAGSERKDLRNRDVMEGVWTGVVPVVETLAEPVPNAECEVGLPGYLGGHVKERNGRMGEYAHQDLGVSK